MYLRQRRGNGDGTVIDHQRQVRILQKRSNDGRRPVRWKTTSLQHDPEHIRQFCINNITYPLDAQYAAKLGKNRRSSLDLKANTLRTCLTWQVGRKDTWSQYCLLSECRINRFAFPVRSAMPCTPSSTRSGVEGSEQKMTLLKVDPHMGAFRHLSRIAHERLFHFHSANTLMQTTSLFISRHGKTRQVV